MGKKEIIFIDKIRVLIEKGKTGNPEELAQKVGLSRRMAYYYIARMKSRGENIKYSRKNRTFYFEEEKEAK